MNERRFTAHAKVLVRLEIKLAELFLVADAGLPDEVFFAAIQATQKITQLLQVHESVVVRAQEPLISIDVMVVHELEE